MASSGVPLLRKRCLARQARLTSSQLLPLRLRFQLGRERPPAAAQDASCAEEWGSQARRSFARGTGMMAPQ